MKQIHPSIGKMSDATFLLFMFCVAHMIDLLACCYDLSACMRATS
jgi:hypothetical protein